MPKLYILYNGSLLELKAYMMKKIKYQLVPQHIHLRNTAERAIIIRIFLSGLASTYLKVPASEWGRLTSQAVITLNILCNSILNPKLLSHEYLHGNSDFNATPIYPPVTIVINHSKYTTRKTWTAHGEDEWYIGPSLENYCCVKFYVPYTNAIQHFDTVKNVPTQIPFPSVTTWEYYNQSEAYIIYIFQITPSVVLSLEYGYRNKNTLLKIS